MRGVWTQLLGSPRPDELGLSDDELRLRLACLDAPVRIRRVADRLVPGWAGSADELLQVAAALGGTE
jgi:hypothetical protein